MADEAPNDDGPGCCAPTRRAERSETSESAEAAEATRPRSPTPRSDGRDPGADHDLVAIDGGTFVMGTDEPYAFAGDGEGPAREIDVSAFGIGRHAVTNEQFGEFVAATGHVTDAERFGWSFVFHLLLPDDFTPTRAVAATPWWRQVYGASWAHPEGPHSEPRRAFGPSRRPRLLVRRRRLLPMGRPASPDRGGVGEGRPGWAGPGPLRLG